DLGILASTDQVALDQACLDLVNKAPWINDVDKHVDLSKADKFTARWPYTRGEVQLVHGEALGMGSRKYELKKI
ncbi:MAG: 4Fe-4S ferredoxin, partial [Deltaproteobacteria bacterium]|nr:4Fe-4S ferredoxin [Deltaproteobacteria bacterium]